jgi:transposase-like protein
MTCHNCKIEAVKAGRGRNDVQRWQCQQCGKRFSEPRQTPFGADVRLPREKVCMILNCLVEGNSVRGAALLCDVQRRTVLNVPTLAGEACERLSTERIQNVHVRDLELDEIWSYVGCKLSGEQAEVNANPSIGSLCPYYALKTSSPR